jgi:hypothetical protein
VQAEVDLGVVAPEGGDRFGQEVPGETLRRDEPDLGAAAAGKPPDLADHLLDVHHVALHETREPDAGLARHHAAGMTLEERHPDLVLEPRDLPADGRTRHVELLGRLGDRARLGHREKVAQAGFDQTGERRRAGPAAPWATGGRGVLGLDVGCAHTTTRNARPLSRQRIDPRLI